MNLNIENIYDFNVNRSNIENFKISIEGNSLEKSCENVVYNISLDFEYDIID